jgi:hypothetical protein
MPKQTQDPVKDEKGVERHPAFGMARFNRVYSSPGAVLFQSDLRHGEYIEVTLYEATRERTLKDDRIFPDKVLVQFDMSMAQFAAFMASGGTEGVPVTISYDHGDRPGLNPESRLALTSSEVHAAAEEAFKDAKDALEAYEQALNDKEPAAFRKLALAKLRAAINNAGPNVDYASKQLAKHAEDVVAKSRADIEAMAASAQQRFGLPVGGSLLELTAPEPGEEVGDA